MIQYKIKLQKQRRGPNFKLLSHNYTFHLWISLMSLLTMTTYLEKEHKSFSRERLKDSVPDLAYSWTPAQLCCLACIQINKQKTTISTQNTRWSHFAFTCNLEESKSEFQMGNLVKKYTLKFPKIWHLEQSSFFINSHSQKR